MEKLTNQDIENWITQLDGRPWYKEGATVGELVAILTDLLETRSHLEKYQELIKKFLVWSIEDENPEGVLIKTLFAIDSDIPKAARGVSFDPEWDFRDTLDE